MTDDDDECRVDDGDDGDGGTVVHLGFIEPVDGDGGGNGCNKNDDCRRRMIGHCSPQYDLWDGGQVGGRPSFLDPENLPMKPITCESCNNNVVMRFVCQIYAPIDEYEERAFHRTLYVFCCPNSSNHYHNNNDDTSLTSCVGSIRVLRVQLPQENPYFPFESSSSVGDNDDDDVDWNKHLPSTYNIQLCQVCGMRGPFKCPLQGCYFCSKQHQKEHKKYVFDRLANKEPEQQQAAGTCSTSSSAAALLPSVYPFAGLVVGEEEQEDDDDDDDTDNDGIKAKNRKTLFDDDDDDDDCSDDRDLEQDDLNRMTGRQHTVETDDTTANFQRKCKANPWQVLRYARTWANNEYCSGSDDDGNGDHNHHHPLWIRADHQPDPEHDIPPCPYCKAPRKFEFQLMPQLLHGLERLHKEQQQKQQQRQPGVLDDASASTKNNVGLIHKEKDGKITKDKTGPTEDSSESKYRQVMEAVQQTEDLIQQAPPEQIPPSLVEAKEAAVERLRQERFGLIASSSSPSSASNKNTGTTSGGIDATVDFGMVAIYTCTKSCNGGEPADGVTVVDPVLGTYREEFAWRQPSLDVP